MNKIASCSVYDASKFKSQLIHSFLFDHLCFIHRLGNLLCLLHMLGALLCLLHQLGGLLCLLALVGRNFSNSLMYPTTGGDLGKVLVSVIIMVFPWVSASQISCDIVTTIFFSWNLEVYHSKSMHIVLEMILKDTFYDTNWWKGPKHMNLGKMTSGGSLSTCVPEFCIYIFKMYHINFYLVIDSLETNFGAKRT